MTEQFTHEPFGERSAPEPSFGTPFERIGAPQLSEPVLQIISLIDALGPDDLRTLSGYLHSKRFPVSHLAHPLANARRLTISDRKSILYLSHYADPKGSRNEMAAIFGISRQRASQIVGAVGCSAADQKLIDLFNRATPGELRSGWRVEAHVEQLNDFREGLIAARPLTPRRMTPSAVGRWSAYGRSFAVYERDRLFYFLIDAPDEEVSQTHARARSRLSMAASPLAAMKLGPIRVATGTNGSPPTERTRSDPPTKPICARSDLGWELMLKIPHQDALELVDLQKRGEQLELSRRIFDKSIPARIIAARLGKKEAIDHNWQRNSASSIAINPSADGYPLSHTNYGVALSEGWLDVDIDSDDPAFALGIVKGLGLKGVRVEYSWGRKCCDGALVPSHIIFKIIGNPDDYRRMFPAPVRLDGALSRVEFAYVRTDPKSKKTPDPTKHAIIPGSVIVDDDKSASLVSWIDHKLNTTPSAQELTSILGGLALGSLIYAAKDYWAEGCRHEFALKFSGALAHILTDVERINSDPSHPLFGNVLAPLDSDDAAARLIQAICETYGDKEVEDRIRTFRDARAKLAAGARIPGRTALKEYSGSNAFADLMWALLIAGTSLSAVHEIYADLILDATDEKYIRYLSRGRFKDGITYHYQREAVQNLWKGKTVTIGRSTKPAFDVYEMGEREEATGGLACCRIMRQESFCFSRAAVFYPTTTTATCTACYLFSTRGGGSSTIP